MQAAILAAQAGAASGKETKISIPTPETTKGAIQYDRLFPARFAQPATYIRFSSTVEDCIGPLYCMNEDDEQALKSLNGHHVGKKSVQCSEEWFEQLVNSFEETTAARQPFAAVDHPPVLSLEELESAFDEDVDDAAKPFAREVYEYWKERRATHDDHSLMAQLKTLKMESGQEADDSDPYVCFRRREHRQARKTRGRDAQVIEKLKKLRKELEDGRVLIDRVKAREVSKREDLALSRLIFEQRAKLRQVKRENNIQDNDEELLVNQKAPKRRVDDHAGGSRPVIKIPQSRDGILAVDADAFQLTDALNKREREISAQINNSVAQHDRWNRTYLDETLAALYDIVSPEDMFVPPEARKRASSDFVSVKLEKTQLPTPPASIVADSEDDDGDADVRMEGTEPQPQERPVKVRWASPVEQKTLKGEGRFRRRVGRGGRVMIDRHNLRPRDRDGQFAFDNDSGDEDEQPEVDLENAMAFTMRAHWLNKDNPSQRRAAAAAASAAHSSPDSQHRPPQTAAPAR